MTKAVDYDILPPPCHSQQAAQEAWPFMLEHFFTKMRNNWDGKLLYLSRDFQPFHGWQGTKMDKAHHCFFDTLCCQWGARIPQGPYVTGPTAAHQCATALQMAVLRCLRLQFDSGFPRSKPNLTQGGITSATKKDLWRGEPSYFHTNLY